MAQGKRVEISVQEAMRRAAEVVQKEFSGVRSGVAGQVLAYPSLWVSTGSYALDWAMRWLAPGGIPFGKEGGWVIHAFGDPSLGKSVLVDHIIRGVQQSQGAALVSETEGSRDMHFAIALGVDLNDGTYQVHRAPPTLEILFDMGFKHHEKFRTLNPTAPFFWAIDSLETIEAGRTFGIQMSGKKGGTYDYGGGRAGVIGAALRKMAHLCATYPTSVLLLNQVRDRPGILFGDPKRPTGGSSPRFLASIEIKLTSSQWGVVRRTDGIVTGRWVHAKVVKNKVAAPFGEADFLIDFQHGIMPWHGVFEQLEEYQVVSIKRNKDKSIAEREFTVLQTGEVIPLTEFTQWVVREHILERPVHQPAPVPQQEAPDGDEG